MTATAYLVGCIDTQIGRFLGCDIFSEAQPTFGAHRFCFTIHEVTRDDFEAAVTVLEDDLNQSPGIRWARKFLVPRRTGCFPGQRYP